MRILRHISVSEMRGGASPPYKVEFLITDRCQSRCRTCGIWRRPMNRNDELSKEQIVHAAKSLGDELLWIGLSGGEPTLRPDFPDIAAGVSASCRNLVLMNFGTNGLDPDNVFKQAAQVAALDIPFTIAAISIDGVGAVHDEIRGIPGAFERMRECADKLIGLEKRYGNFSVSFQTTVSPLNRRSVSGISDFLNDRFPGHSHIATVATDSFLVSRGMADDLKAGLREIEAIRKLASQMPFHNFIDILPRAYLAFAISFLDRNRSPLPCAAGKDMIIVDAAGGVRPCDFVSETVGNLSEFDYDLRSLLTAPGVRSRLDSFASCRDCFSPCQAFPSLLRHPAYLLWGLLRSLTRRAPE